MSKAGGYRQILRELVDRIPFLRRESGLPGPQGNRHKKRAAAAALAEPRLLKESQQARKVLQVLDEIRDESFKILRQAIGYCWSVAVAEQPEQRHPVDDEGNPEKNRLVKVDAGWVEACLGKLGQFA